MGCNCLPHTFPAASCSLSLSPPPSPPINCGAWQGLDPDVWGQCGVKASQKKIGRGESFHTGTSAFLCLIRGAGQWSRGEELMEGQVRVGREWSRVGRGDSSAMGTIQGLQGAAAWQLPTHTRHPFPCFPSLLPFKPHPPLPSQLTCSSLLLPVFFHSRFVLYLFSQSIALGSHIPSIINVTLASWG